MFRRFFTRASEFYHSEQLDAFFTWVGSETFPEPFFILIDLPLQTEILDRHRKKVSEKNNLCGFVICSPNKRKEASVKLHCTVSETSWHKIWYAEGMEILENEEIHRGTLPLRFGLSLSEKRELLRFARQTMQSFLNGEHSTFQLDLAPHRTGEKVVVDVGIWINGKLRGSIISSPLPLIDALREASVGALRDSRMKPVEKDELEVAQIEVSIMSNLVLPLRQQDMVQKIDACKGYYVESGKQRGWYLPTVFNCMKFKDMADLRRSLVKGKANITERADHVPLHAFQVEGFIEDKKHILMLLEGPVAYTSDPSSNSFLKRVKAHSDEAAQWLLNMCDTHGALPLYRDPLYQQTGRMDWARLANASYALAAFGTVTKNQQYIQTSEKISAYMQRYIVNDRQSRVTIGTETIPYLLHAALTRLDHRESPLLDHVQDRYENTTFHPITYAVLASLFAKLTLLGIRDYRTESISLAEKVFADFKKNKEVPETQLAWYPELIYAFQLLHALTQETLHLERSEEVATWLVHQQLSNGSFPIYKDSSFSYTRGTGKIFEVLALHPTRYDNAVEKSFDWLTRMQYTEDSLYFTDPSFKGRVKGGFRHDHANTEAWIDSASHFLLGAARLLAPRAPGDK